MIPIGAHVPVAGGLVKRGLAYADDLAAEAIQIFVTNPRGWAMPDGSPDEDKRFRAACEERDLPVFVHTPYLVNVGSLKPDIVAKSLALLRHTLVRSAAVGARGVVVHTGSAVAKDGREQAMRQVRESLLPLLDDPGLPRVLLEPMAGQGAMLCATVPDLAAYLDVLDRHPRAGVCLDTCHMYAAGYDLGAEGGMSGLLDEFDRLVGGERLGLVHANDSKDALGSAKDRHENIGAGGIGAAAFAELLAHPVIAGGSVPCVVETPGPEERHRADVRRLQDLRAQLSGGPSDGSS
jgi:deoxyribonuclease IV